MYIIDNDSSDNSICLLKEGGFPVEIATNSRNLGFAAACNQGAALGIGKYILFLNPDMVLESGSLAKPLGFMEAPENQAVGIVGIQLKDDRGNISRNCARFPTPRMFFSRLTGLDHVAPKHFPGYHMTEWAHDTSADVDHVIGAFYLIRRSVFEALKGFDERFFVYLEDLDLSLRARRAGYVSHYLADIQAYHKGGATTAQFKAHRLLYALQSRILYGYKHFNKLTAFLLMLGTFSVEPLARLASLLTGRAKGSIFEIFRGYLMLWQTLPSIIRNTRRV